MLKQRLCVSCGARGWSPCHACVSRFEPAASVEVEGARSAMALVEFKGEAREVVHALKFGGAKSLASWFGGPMAGTVSPDVDAITWAPTTKARRRVRGYDQAELVARAVGAAAGIRCLRLLKRVDNATSQTAMSATARCHGPQFSVCRNVVTARICLVDDVITTGATARSAVGALRLGSAMSVDVHVIARTPPPGDG